MKILYGPLPGYIQMRARANRRALLVELARDLGIVALVVAGTWLWCSFAFGPLPPIVGAP